jgi:protein-disulfide isomerase
MSSGTTITPPDQETPAERNSVLLLVIGALVAISAVIAGLVIFSSGEAPAEKPEAQAPIRAGDLSLLVGKADARQKVVVYEDFASPGSRQFEIASRDFLRIEAARGRVQVEYRPFPAVAGDYSSGAMAAWTAVLTTGTPTQALSFHDVLFDRQPDSGALATDEFRALAKASGIDGASVLDAIGAPDREMLTKASQAAREAQVSATPTVLVDGDPLTGDSPVQLSDKLQRLLLNAE